MKNKESLYTLRDDVKCIKCGNIGAVQYYGDYYPNGLRDEVDSFGEVLKPIMEKHRKVPYMSYAMGFGGTIPHVCLNCGNTGLIGIGGLEGYQEAFTIVKKEED